MFLIYYAIYTALVILIAVKSPMIGSLGTIIAYGVAPLTLLTFAASFLVSRSRPQT